MACRSLVVFGVVYLNHVYIHGFRSVIEATGKLKQWSGTFPWKEAFDCLKWTYDEALQRLFGLGKGICAKMFQNSNAWGVAQEGDADVDLTGTQVQQKCKRSAHEPFI